MAHKHLKELLNEDQEPFHLKDLIADRQFYLKKQAHRTQIQLKKPKPISKNSSFICRNACFFSLNDPPSPCKSPLFDFGKNPCKSPNRVFLHVPAKTASMLLEAAIRIQKQTKSKTQTKNSGFGLFGLVLKRLTNRNRAQKLKGNETEQIKTGENSGEVIAVGVEDKVISVIFSTSSSSSSSSATCSCNGRQSSLDLESSSSGRSFNGDDDHGFEFANLDSESDGACGHCLRPLSPFHYALRSSPSPDRRSPVKSPVHHKFEEKVKHELGRLDSFQTVQEEDEVEEDKEQNSPVSVLDPQFEDDYDELEDDGYGVESNYAFVQRSIMDFSSTVCVGTKCPVNLAFCKNSI